MANFPRGSYGYNTVFNDDVSAIFPCGELN